MVGSELVSDPAAVMTSWKSGSVVGSWLLDLLAAAFRDDPTLEHMPPVANESGEAKWMIEAALELGVPTPATAAAAECHENDAIVWEVTMRGLQSAHPGADTSLRPRILSP